MIRRGSWVLGFFATVALLAGGALALWPVLTRETVLLHPILVMHPRSDAEVSLKQFLGEGVRLAVEDAGHRAGNLRVETGVPFTYGPVAGTSISLLTETSVPVEVDSAGSTVTDVRGVSTLMTGAGGRAGPEADRLAKHLGIRSVFLLVDAQELELSDNSHSSYGSLNSAILPTFTRSFRNGPGSTFNVAGVEAVDVDKPDPVARRAARWKTDAIVIDVPGAGASLVRALRAAGHRGRIILSAESLSDGFAEEGVFVVGVLHPAPPSEFVERYTKSRGHTPHPIAWEAYRQAGRQLDAWTNVGTVSEAQRTRPEPEPSLPIGSYRVRHSRLVPLDPAK